MSFVAENACMRLAFHILVLLDSHRYAGLPTLSVPSTQDAKDRVPDRASNDDKLALYGLFKQATVGDNTTNKPGFLDQKGEEPECAHAHRPTPDSGFSGSLPSAGRAKWDAWTKQKGKDKVSSTQNLHS